MMTSTPVTQQQQTDGRTVREVVEFNQELVNEVWCRRIFRQILQSLELQYAMQMPHRPINPDTVLVLDSGDPMLLPSPETGAAWSEAGDMHDLAAVVHYAITREFPPAAPLLGRLSDTASGGEYSDSFVSAVDRCLSPDPEQRPRNIDGLRNLLGIVPLGPAITSHAVPHAAAQPVPQPAPPFTASGTAEPAASFLDEPAPATGRGRLQRWLLLVAAATILLSALGALFALLHQTDSRDALVLALPGDEPAEQAPVPAAPANPPPPADAPAEGVAGTPFPDAAAPVPGALGQPAPGMAPPTAITVTPATGQNGQPPANRQVLPVSGATYKLVIKPWGMIQVDGVERGVSPPIKRLTLPPGQHTIRIVNPNYPEHTVTVNAVKGDSSVIELDFTEEVTE